MQVQIEEYMGLTPLLGTVGVHGNSHHLGLVFRREARTEEKNLGFCHLWDCFYTYGNG